MENLPSGLRKIYYSRTTTLRTRHTILLKYLVSDLKVCQGVGLVHRSVALEIWLKISRIQFVDYSRLVHVFIWSTNLHVLSPE